MVIQSLTQALPSVVTDQVVLHFPAHFLAAGTLGLAVNLLSTIIIQLAGATTVKLLGAGRGILVVFCGMLLFAESVRPESLGLILLATFVRIYIINYIYKGK